MSKKGKNKMDNKNIDKKKQEEKERLETPSQFDPGQPNQPASKPIHPVNTEVEHVAVDKSVHPDHDTAEAIRRKQGIDEPVATGGGSTPDASKEAPGTPLGHSDNPVNQGEAANQRAAKKGDEDKEGKKSRALTGVAGAAGAPALAPIKAGSINDTQMVADGRGGVYLIRGNEILRTNNGKLIPVAGKAEAGDSGDGGQAVNALLNKPTALAVDAAGNLFIYDSGNGKIRRIVNGVIKTIAEL